MSSSTHAIALAFVVLALTGCAAVPRSAPYSARLVATNGAPLPTMQRGTRTVALGTPAETYEIVLVNTTQLGDKG